MFLTEITRLKTACLHHIGSKVVEEGIMLSSEGLKLDDESLKNLISYCFSSFKNEEKSCFTNEVGLEFNETMACVKKIFSNPEAIVEQSQLLAKVLYDRSDHPGIKSGDFIVAYFTDCDLDGYITDAIGLYKCENPTSFLQTYCNGGKTKISTLKGFDLRRVDKAALIFNISEESGYQLAIIDNTNKTEAKYWVEDFLQAKPRSDEYHQTRSVLSAAKSFIMKGLPSEREVTKGEQAELMDKTMRYFQENEKFDIADFSNVVMGDSQLSSDFGQYMDSYMEKNNLEQVESFDISSSAVKKSSRSMKSVIKLDKNFHIYVHGGDGLIKRGYDEATGMEYYQLYFKNEE